MYRLLVSTSFSNDFDLLGKNHGMKKGKKSLPASGNKVFLQKNGFSLISVTVFTCRKKDQITENGFHRTENAFPPY